MMMTQRDYELVEDLAFDMVDLQHHLRPWRPGTRTALMVGNSRGQFG